MKNSLKTLVLFVALLITNSCSSSGEEPTPPTTGKAVASISASISQAMEPNVNGEFTIKLTKNVGSETTINLKLTGTAKNGEDYKTISNTIFIPAKSNLLKIPVEILADQIVEGDETIIATISINDNAFVMVGNEASATITIKDGALTIDLKPGDARNYMVNKNATDETVALFYNLKTLAKTAFTIGQHDAMIANYKEQDTGSRDTDIKKTTGYDPGMNGADFMFITDDENTGAGDNWYFGQEKMIVAGAEKAYDKGMINMFCWHFREPFEGKYFSTGQLSNNLKRDAFKSILVGGVNHEYYKQKLQKIAQVVKAMKGKDGKLVPIIFRPFHEFDGDWFWWGKSYCSPAEFIQNWQFTVKYLRDDLQVNNMLFAFSPDQGSSSESEYLSRYPGDEYVDVLGFDDYEDFKNKGADGVNSANKKLQIISNLAKERVKIAGLTESSYIVKPSDNQPFIKDLYSNNYYKAMTENNVEISFMAFWSNSKDSYCTPTPGSPYEIDFLQFSKMDKVALLNKLPNMYKMP